MGDGNEPAIVGRHNDPPYDSPVRHLNTAILAYAPAVILRIYDGLVERGSGTEAAEGVRPYLDPTGTTIAVGIPATASAIGTIYHHQGVTIPGALRAMARAVEELPDDPTTAQAMLHQAGPTDLVIVDAALVTEATRET